MSIMIKELYDALKEAGASEEKASAAAIALSAYSLDRAHLATRADIEKMGRIIVMWNVGTVIAVAGLVFAIIRFAA
jgi:hypothetical protein